ncbi:MAG: hypothetical protein EXS18_04200 [Verrucomicrobiae bacterium]|nr:hypothetical protein [Verrucomicrobiae bacterium]
MLIKEQVVEAACAVSELPPGIERIDCSHSTILPGLIDAHVHYSSPMGPASIGAGVTTIRDVGNDLEWILKERAAHAEDVTLGPGIVCCDHLLDGSPAHWPRVGRPHADEESLREGRIAPGFQAELVAVEGDPLQRIQDIANVQCVVRAGRVFRLQELHKLARSYHDTDPTDPVTMDSMAPQIT